MFNEKMSTEACVMKLHESGVSRTRAAELLGVPRHTLNAMIDALGIDWPRRRRKGLIVLDGIQDTWEAHSKRTGKTISALRWSLAKTTHQQEFLSFVRERLDEAA